MSEESWRTTRRAVLGGLAALPFAGRLAAADSAPLTRAIPADGARLPLIGMGTWITFNVGDDAGLRAQRSQVLQAFFEAGGGLIDSSPMYGSSEAVIGHALEQTGQPASLFSATKVWTWTQAGGVEEIEASRRLWGVERFDLLQVHNLLSWESHLETLRRMKAEGRLRYIGITTSHGRRHDDFEAVMRQEDIDFVQFTYNVLDREAEARLLPLAAERGLAVIINRPFRRGALFDRFAGHPLPDWAAEIDCANWAQFFLKFVVSHPAVTCAIPATSRVDHMAENMGVLYGRLPDADLRRRMIATIEAL
ncbi:aldo/keto reductase [Pelagibius litoralis]|uniref:Aldo/keto reductase n=1 Tax=Pelagibius litoralis TaxID=374515 RepID=A0A967F2P9_9PROT|nr:aldo/keto reductase [Pelagibius litoralis]NIA71932.1 aldo/keto reductase [Pelagibius litoralis]